MGMKCLGRTSHCDDPDCAKQVDITGEAPTHLLTNLEAEAKHQLNE